jgi:hypothetical protein
MIGAFVQTKTRALVLTDIENDPDDAMSMVRLGWWPGLTSISRRRPRRTHPRDASMLTPWFATT